MNRPRLLLGFAHDAIAVVTRHNRVVAVDPRTGASSKLADALECIDSGRLLTAARTRGGNIVYASDQTTERNATRSDLFLWLEPSAIGGVLTEGWKGVVHAEPSFSPDCRRVVFISDAE